MRCLTSTRRSGGGLRGFGFVFQLLRGALGVRDVVSFAEVDGLVDAATFPEGVEVANLDHRTDPGNGLVGRDGDVTYGLQAL